MLRTLGLILLLVTATACTGVNPNALPEDFDPSFDF